MLFRRRQGMVRLEVVGFVGEGIREEEVQGGGKIEGKRVRRAVSGLGVGRFGSRDFGEEDVVVLGFRREVGLVVQFLKYKFFGNFLGEFVFFKVVVVGGFLVDGFF